MDKSILDQFIPVADGIATLLSPYAEVVIHDMETQKILHISNSFSKRESGFPSNLEAAEFRPGRDVIGPYGKINWDSRRLKSVSVVIKDTAGEPAGLLCINLDISVADELTRVMSAFISSEDMAGQPEELFRNDWHEKVNTYIHNWAAENGKTVQTLAIGDKRVIVEALYGQGAFKHPKSHEYVAGVLGLARATVFKYVKQIREA